jgi:hypothetical protein
VEDQEFKLVVLQELEHKEELVVVEMLQHLTVMAQVEDRHQQDRQILVVAVVEMVMAHQM